MTFIPTRRTSLLVKTGARRESHLFFVLTDPHGDPPAVLMVNVTSVRRYVPHDKTCILDADDHKFLDRPSWVAYQFAEIMPVPKIARGVRSGDMKAMGAISEACCARVSAGVHTSPAIPLRCKRFFEAAMANGSATL